MRRPQRLGGDVGDRRRRLVLDGGQRPVPNVAVALQAVAGVVAAGVEVPVPEVACRPRHGGGEQRQRGDMQPERQFRQHVEECDADEDGECRQQRHQARPQRLPNQAETGERQQYAQTGGEAAAEPAFGPACRPVRGGMRFGPGRWRHPPPRPSRTGRSSASQGGRLSSASMSSTVKRFLITAKSSPSTRTSGTKGRVL